MTPRVYTSGCGWTPTCTHTRTCVRTHAHTRTRTHSHTCTRTHAHTCTCAHAHTLLWLHWPHGSRMLHELPCLRVCSCDPHASLPVETTRLPLKCNCEERGPKLSFSSVERASETSSSVSASHFWAFVPKPSGKWEKIHKVQLVVTVLGLLSYNSNTLEEKS